LGSKIGAAIFEIRKDAMSKPRVLVCVLCGPERGDWLNPVLTVNLLVMAKDPRFDVAYQPVYGYRPWDYARNQTINLARSMKADWLISFDNDNCLDCNPLDIIEEAGNDKDVIGLTCGVGCVPECRHFPSHNHGVIDGSFREEKTVGGGVLMVHRRVWEQIPRGPWFRWQHADNELLAPDVGAVDEVTSFCNLVKQHGFRVWTHRSILAAHLKTEDLTKLVSALNGKGQP
jgi:hypothetical protein